jgi:hypothetical protein
MYENDVNEDDSDYDKMIQNKVIDSLPSSHRKSPNNYTFEKLENMGNEDNEEEIDSDINSREDGEVYISPVTSNDKSLKSRNSRKLFVIEEEQSNLGGQQSTYRSKNS